MAAVGVVAFIVVEGYTYRRYVLLGSEFHFWLHTLFGAAVGMALIAVLSLARPRMRVPGLVIGGLAHLWSAFPDFLFIAVGAVHQRWMDVFAGHISVHFVPRPIVTSAGLLVLAGTAVSLAQAGRRWFASVALATTLALGGLAFTVRAPIPSTLEQVRDNPQIVLVCPLLGPTVASQPPMSSSIAAGMSRRVWRTRQASIASSPTT